MGASPQCGAEVGGQHTDIGPGRTAHRGLVHGRVGGSGHLEVMDGHWSGCSVNLASLPCDLVKAAASHPDGGDHWRNLLEFPYQAGGSAPDVTGADQ